jgi:hypothetical protein
MRAMPDRRRVGWAIRNTALIERLQIRPRAAFDARLIGNTVDRASTEQADRLGCFALDEHRTRCELGTRPLRLALDRRAFDVHDEKRLLRDRLLQSAGVIRPGRCDLTEHHERVVRRSGRMRHADAGTNAPVGFDIERQRRECASFVLCAEGCMPFATGRRSGATQA